MTAANSECPLCKSGASQHVAAYSAMLNLPGNSDSQVLRCDRCGVLYLWPYVSDDALAAMYGKGYFTGAPEGHADLSFPSVEEDYEQDTVSVRLRKFHKTVEFLLRLVPNARSVLDIGAATGDFLCVAREHGLSISGIELSAYAAARAKEKFGIDLQQTPLEEYTGAEEYDLIHMNHVFEHFRAPRPVLERLDSLLAERGTIYVEVPFQFNLLERLKYRVTKARKAFDVSSVHHPIFYTPRTLQKAFADQGFSCRWMGIFDWSRYPAKGVIGQLKRLMWFAASLAGEGLYIEAVFERRKN